MKNPYQSMLRNKICTNIWATLISEKRTIQRSQKVLLSVWEVENMEEDLLTLNPSKNLIWAPNNTKEAFFSQEV